MKILILGMGPTREKAPKADEVWGLPWSRDWMICDRLFEMHDWRLVNKVFLRPADYQDRLKLIPKPIYMRHQHEDFPSSLAYPLEAVQIDVFRHFPGEDYLCSSVAYMLALAIHLDPEWIGLYGVEARGRDGFEHQRPNLECLLGIAMGRGIDIEIAEKSELLMYEPNQVYGSQKVYYPKRYGELPDNWLKVA